MERMGSKILITGHKGFIGSALFKKLSQKHQVLGFDRRDKLPKEKVDIVYHLAANANVCESVKNPELATENVSLTYEILEWMIKTKTKRVIFTSSREVFSQINPYGRSKAACETLIKHFCEIYGIQATIVRLPNIYGKNDKPYRFFPTVLNNAANNKDIFIYGKKILNFVYLKNCIDHLINLRYKNGVLNMAYPKSYNLEIIAKKIIHHVGSRSKIILKGNRKGETMKYIPKNIDLLCSTSIDEGIKNIL